MHGTTAEREAVGPAIPDVGRTCDERDAINSPLLQNRIAEALMRRSRTGRILLSSSPAFRILMVGSSVSMFGSRISTVAFPMLVLNLNNSPFVTGLVAFLVIIPSVLIYMPAGALVDRWNPRRVMFTSELLRGLVIASVVFSLIIFRSHVSIGFLISAMVVEEILEIFFTLADRRYLSRLMERDNVASRQAYVEVRSHAVILAGRPLGPFLFEISAFLPFLADALSFLFSAVSLAMIKDSGESAEKFQRVRARRLVGDIGLVEDIGQGYNWLRRDRRALRTMILMAATSLVAQALILMFLSEAHSDKLSVVAIGIVLAASGTGGAAGSILSRFLPGRIRHRWLPIQMVAWCVALVFLAIAGVLTIFWSAVAMLILGFTGAMGNIEFWTYLVSNVGDDMIAKVTGIGQMFFIGACALGPVLGGAAFQHYGSRGAIMILLGIMVLLAFFSLFAPERNEASSREIAAESGNRDEANRADPLAEAPAVARGDGGQNRDAKGEFFWETFGYFPLTENGRPWSIGVKGALTWENASQ